MRTPLLALSAVALVAPFGSGGDRAVPSTDDTVADTAADASGGGAGTPDASDAPPGTNATPTGETITLVTNDAFSSIAHVLDAFTAETGVAVELVAGGDAGALVNQVILTKDDPLGDVLFGFDNSFLSRVLDSDILVPYEPAAASSIPEAMVLDPEFRAVPTDFGDVCINYDKGWFDEEGIAVPETLEQLTEPQYEGLLTVMNPATASPGTAFMLATIAAFGEEGWLEFWEGLVDNDVEVVSGWDQAYYTSFSGSSGEGPRPLVVSYASSPPAEVIFADPPLEEAPTGVMEASCFRQIEFIGILEGTDHLEAAQQLVDWWLSDSMQSQLPLNYFVFPIIPDTELPPEFIEHTLVPENPLTVAPEEIEANRERWIEEWTSTVLR